MKTTSNMEDYIPQFMKLMQIGGSPKWMALRMFINFSLGIKKHDFLVDAPDFSGGKEYRLLQVTGLGKELDDHTLLYSKMISLYDKIEISDNKMLDKHLALHAYRGYISIKNSLSSKSNVFEFLAKEIGLS